jgi:hypothetical protein
VNRKGSMIRIELRALATAGGFTLTRNGPVLVCTGSIAGRPVRIGFTHSASARAWLTRRPVLASEPQR